MSTPEKPREKDSPETASKPIGTLKVREEEGLTRDPGQDSELSDADLDGVSGGIANPSRLKPE
jgi:hypothetical protein